MSVARESESGTTINAMTGAGHHMNRNRTISTSSGVQWLQISPSEGPSRRLSRVELVSRPDGAGVELMSVDDDRGLNQHSESFATYMTIGAITAQLDKKAIDKQIKAEVGHHNTAAIDTFEEKFKEARNKSRARIPGDDIVAFMLRHLHCAMASPIIFRVPFLVMKHSTSSGSAFLICYCVMMLLVGAPLYSLEVIMAQYSSLGPINIYRCMPSFTGVGSGMLVLCFLLMCYISSVVCWSIFYFLQGFSSPLPWENCPPNTSPVCVSATPSLSPTPAYNNSSTEPQPVEFSYIPSEYFFKTEVTGSLFNAESVSFLLHQPILLFAVWFIIFFCLVRRRKWQSDRFSWVVAAVTNGTLLVLFILGLEQDDADRGIQRAFIFDFSEMGQDLANPTIWMDALGQVFWSMGIGVGFLIMGASYNNFRDSVNLNMTVAIFCNLIVTVLTVLAIFPYTGELYDFAEVAPNPGFFFVMTSLAATKTASPQATCFFLYGGLSILLVYHLLTLADTVMASLAELSSMKWRTGFRRIFLNAVICLAAFGACFYFVSTDGIYLVTSLDSYLPWISSALFAVLELVAFVYLYGYKNISDQLKRMNNTSTVYMHYWRFVLPPLLVGGQVWAWVVGMDFPISWAHEPTGREDMNRIIGLVLAVLPLGSLIYGTVMVFYFYRQSDDSMMKPLPTWGPAIQQHRKLYTVDILRATQRVPWLVMQTDGDLVAESGMDGWLPTGYAFLPQDTTYVLLSSTLTENIDETGRRTVVNNFISRFGSHRRNVSDNTVSRCAHCQQRSEDAAFKRRRQNSSMQRKPRSVSRLRAHLTNLHNAALNDKGNQSTISSTDVIYSDGGMMNDVSNEFGVQKIRSHSVSCSNPSVCRVMVHRNDNEESSTNGGHIFHKSNDEEPNTNLTHIFQRSNNEQSSINSSRMVPGNNTEESDVNTIHIVHKTINDDDVNSNNNSSQVQSPNKRKRKTGNDEILLQPANLRDLFVPQIIISKT